MLASVEISGMTNEFDGLRKSRVPEKLNIISMATARILLGVESIFLSARTCNSHRRSRWHASDGRQPEAAKDRLEPRSGTKEDELRAQKHLKRFWNDSQLECILSIERRK